MICSSTLRMNSPSSVCLKNPIETIFRTSNSCKIDSICALGKGSLSESAARVFGPSLPSMSTILILKASCGSISLDSVHEVGSASLNASAISKLKPPVYSSRKSSISPAPLFESTPSVPWTSAMRMEYHLSSTSDMPVLRIFVIAPEAANSTTQL